MNKVIGLALLSVILVAATIFVGAFIGGTILFWVAPIVLPFLKANGLKLIAPSWWQSVCFVWVLGILGGALFKNSSTSVSSK